MFLDEKQSQREFSSSEGHSHAAIEPHTMSRPNTKGTCRANLLIVVRANNDVYELLSRGDSRYILLDLIRH